MDKFKENNPEEAAALEREFPALFESANLETDPWLVKIFSRYPSNQEWEDNPELSGFIHDL